MNDGLRKLTFVFALVGGAVALAIGAMTTVSVIGRAFFRSPIQGDVEVTQLGIALAISLCIPWCQMQGGNIIVDFFTQRLADRPRRRLDAVGAVLVAVMCLLLAWRTGVSALAVKEAGETTMIMSLPMWWAYASLAPGLALAGVVAATQAVMQWRGRAMPHAVGAGE